MVAGIEAARAGAAVVLVDQKEKIGKKIYATGNGKCNFTNQNQHPAYYRCEDVTFPEKIFQYFSKDDTLSYFHALGILPKDKNGYLYPGSEQASAVVDVLTMELSRLHVKILTETKVLGIQHKNEFQIQTDKGMLSADACIIACGLKASPKLGSDGSLLPEIEKLGHHMIEVVPALVQLKAKPKFFPKISGIRFEMTLTLYINNKRICQERGEVQLTDYGLSGIPTFQVSRYAAKAFQKKQKVTAILDLFPDLQPEEMRKEMQFRFYKQEGKTALECLVGLLPYKLIPVLLKECRIEKDTKASSIPEENVQTLCHLLKSWKIELTDTNGFSNAQVCAGGLDTRELYANSLESKQIKELYFAGEVIDVDGICGGYNLQWAWSSGVLAGRSAAKTVSLTKEV